MNQSVSTACLAIQDWLANYLNTTLDPYDFTMFIGEWAESIGLQRVIDHDESAGDL